MFKLFCKKFVKNVNFVKIIKILQNCKFTELFRKVLLNLAHRKEKNPESKYPDMMDFS